MTVHLKRGDITTFEGDAIVNAANSHLIHGGGVARAISVAAGPGLDEESRVLVEREGLVSVGSAVVTGGHDLPVDWVIHAVGPVYGEHGGEEAELLARAYRSCLDLAREHQVETVAFPAISAGIFGFPLEEAARIAVETVREQARDIEVTFVLFGERTYRVFETALNS